MRVQALRKVTFCREYSVIVSSRASGMPIIDFFIKANDCSTASIT